jgi:hypothetical protein
MKYKIILLVFLLLILILGFFFVKNNKALSPSPVINEIKQEDTVSLCYYYSNKTDRGFYDKTYLRLNISGEKVTGEFSNYPAEKDSKVGTFEGVVGSVDKSSMGRTAELWWDSFAEGMKVKEELNIEFGDGSASALYGEMIDRGDGVYVYKNKTEIFFGPSLGQISCEDMDEIVTVEKYIKDNIKTIATNKPVLGGSWYMTSVFVDYILDKGTVTYEDGHIQASAVFEYKFSSNTKNVTITKFEVQK